MPMRAEEFRARGEQLFGGRGWQMGLSRALNRTYPCIRNWTSGRAPVPPEVVAILELLEATERTRWPARWTAIGDGSRRRLAS